ncbi:zinc ribbon domain-containing protein [Rasiella sp. SM2506]|uniref:zinc ribbon domain-containing protein n=1 Tax=Rasiella sp. SM2506 TaxID=3423914 RepID=UPI003D7BEA66
MSINIPDSLPKLLILLGIIGVAFGIFIDKELSEKYSSRFDKYDKIQDSVVLRTFTIELEREKLLQRSEELSETYKVENPIVYYVDSSMVFTRTFSGNKDKKIVTDSLDQYWDSYVEKKAALKILTKRQEIELENLKEKEEIIDGKKDFYGAFLGIGFILFILGISTWIFDNITPVEKPIKQNEKIYRYCQSCGYNFNSMKPYGTEKNKSKSNAFCKDCYKKGKFTEPNLTKKEFLEIKKKEVKKKWWLSKKLLMTRFKNLERWNKNDYF